MPGYGGGTCYELDLLEANNNAMQTAIHTELGGSYGSGNCDRNGCFARVGGPEAPWDRKDKFGKGSRFINSEVPFGVTASVDNEGALTILLSQQGRTVTSFDRRMAGNPQGKGVPASALAATLNSMGKLALVASLWTSPDLSWLDGPGCATCSLPDASFIIADVKTYTADPPSPPPPVLLPPPVPPPTPLSSPPPLNEPSSAAAKTTSPAGAAGEAGALGFGGGGGACPWSAGDRCHFLCGARDLRKGCPRSGVPPPGSRSLLAGSGGSDAWASSHVLESVVSGMGYHDTSPPLCTWCHALRSRSECEGSFFVDVDHPLTASGDIAIRRCGVQGGACKASAEVLGWPTGCSEPTKGAAGVGGDPLAGLVKGPRTTAGPVAAPAASDTHATTAPATVAKPGPAQVPVPVPVPVAAGEPLLANAPAATNAPGGAPGGGVLGSNAPAVSAIACTSGFEGDLDHEACLAWCPQVRHSGVHKATNNCLRCKCKA